MRDRNIIKRTKEEVTIEDLEKIKKLTKRIKSVKEELIKLMEEKDQISSEMYDLMRDGYSDIEIEDGEEVDMFNTSPKFMEAIKEYEDIMDDTKDFWLDYIGHRNKN